MNTNFLKENKLVLQFSSFHLISSFAFSIFAPFMSLILLEKGFQTYEITYFFAIFTLGVFLFSPILGKISDEIGKKKIILVCLFIESISVLSYYFIENIYLLFAIRFIDAIAYSGIFFVMIGSFQDMIENKRGFWTGVYMSLGTVGALFGPILAGVIISSNSNLILLLFGFFLILFSLIYLLFIPEKKKPQKKISKSDFNILLEIKHFLKFKELRGMGILGILMNSKSEIYLIFFPILVVTTLEISEIYLGILISIPLFFRSFQFYFGKIGDSISSEFGVLLGVFLAAASIFFLPYVDKMYELVILLMVYGIGGSIWNVNAWSLMGNIAKKYDMEGEIVGTYVSISKIGVFISTLLSATLIKYLGISYTLQLFAILILIGVSIVYFFFEPIFHHESKENILIKGLSLKK